MIKFFTLSKKNLIITASIFLLIAISITSTAVYLCNFKPKIYEISMEKELFEMAKERGVFEEKITLEKYPEDTAFEVHKYKNIHIEIISSELAKQNEPAYKNSKTIGSITRKTKYTPIENHYDGVKGIELSRKELFVCRPFEEDSPDFIALEDTKGELLYEFDEIPENYISFPVKIDRKIYYPDNLNYPFWKIQYADFDFTQFLQTSKKNSKSDTYAYNYAEKVLLQKVFYNKLRNIPYNQCPKITFIAAVGDMMLGRGVQKAMAKEKSAAVAFTDTLPVLQNNDFTIGNLECVITNRNIKTEKTYNFKVPEDALTYLKEAGFDYLMMTNNHCYDYGEAGFKDTLKAVKEAGFATSGVGYNKTEALEFYRTTINGQNFSVLSVGAYPVESKGFNGEKQATATETRAGILWKSQEVIDLITEEKKTGSVIIINAHAGSEYRKNPNKLQKEFYIEMCDAGADVIFGSHPHVLQPVEMYNKSLIVWSLGNFIFPGMEEMPGATDTMIIRTGFIENKLVYYEKHPATIDGKKVKLK